MSGLRAGRATWRRRLRLRRGSSPPRRFGVKRYLGWLDFRRKRNDNCDQPLRNFGWPADRDLQAGEQGQSKRALDKRNGGHRKRTLARREVTTNLRIGGHSNAPATCLAPIAAAPGRQAAIHRPPGYCPAHGAGRCTEQPVTQDAAAYKRAAHSAGNEARRAPRIAAITMRVVGPAVIAMRVIASARMAIGGSRDRHAGRRQERCCHSHDRNAFHCDTPFECFAVQTTVSTACFHKQLGNGEMRRTRDALSRLISG